MAYGLFFPLDLHKANILVAKPLCPPPPRGTVVLRSPSLATLDDFQHHHRQELLQYESKQKTYVHITCETKCGTLKGTWQGLE